MNCEELKLAVKEFDSVIANNESFHEFCKLFDKYGKDCPEIMRYMLLFDRLLNADFLNQCNDCQLFAIQMGAAGFKEKIVRRFAQVILDCRIPAEIRAVFFNTLVEYSIGGGKSCIKRLREGMTFDRNYMFYIVKKYDIGVPEQVAFAKQMLSMIPERALQIIKSWNERIEKSIEIDSVSSFEINRSLLGLDIGVSLIDYLIWKGAINIFSYLLIKYPDAMFRIRSKDNWLFAILNSNLTRNKTLLFIEAFENMEPGICSRIRDPWGNSLLAYTFDCRFEMYCEKVQKYLIKKGCINTNVSIMGIPHEVIRNNGINKYCSRFKEKYCK